MYRPEYENTIKSVSLKLKIPFEWLKRILRFESNFNPLAINKTSGAAGLIQFLPSTAQKMGYKGSIDLVQKHSTFSDQLQNPVYNYLKKMAPFTSEIDFYMSVFYPAYRKVSPLKRFPDNVIKSNAGVIRPIDYFNKVIAANSGFLYTGLRYTLYGIAIFFAFIQLKKWSFKHVTKKT
jgi:hypothetical protein